METSVGVANIFTALAKAQAAFQPVKEDAENKHLGYRYTTLAGVLDATREILAQNDLGVVQSVTSYPDKAAVGVTTTLFHTSGQWMRSTLAMPYVPHKSLSPAQTMGVAITYARRYALMAMLGVSSAQDDTDAVTAQPLEHTHDRHGQAPREQTKESRAAYLKLQLDGFKENLQTATTEEGVNNFVRFLLDVTGELPPKIMDRVNALASERRTWLKEHPPTGFGKDAPNEEDSAAVNAPEPKPNGAANSIVYELDNLRGKIRKATAMDALDDIARVLDGIYMDKSEAIFTDAAAKEAWEAATEFLSARRRFIEQGNGA